MGKEKVVIVRHDVAQNDIVRSAYSVVSNTHDALRATLRSLMLVVGLFLFFTLPSHAQSPDDKPTVSGGRALWAENCAPCHGPAGGGDGPTSQSIENGVPSFLDPEIYRTKTPAEQFDIIKNGRIENLMPPWGNRFEDSQIWDLTAYVWSLHTTPDSLTNGAEIYTDRCAGCHGEGGAGDGVQAAANINNLADWQVVSQQSLADWQGGFATVPDHAELSDLSEEALWLALDHVRTFSFAMPQRNGVLSGQIINGTANQPQGDLEVTLYTFTGNAAADQVTTQADSDGNYRFEHLSTDPDLMYVVEGRYDEVSYLSPPSPFAGSNEQKLDLNVYDTTTDSDGVTLSRLNNLVSFTPETVRMIELFVVGNSGDKTYIGRDGSTFAFRLPADATNVSFQNDLSNRFVKTDEGGYTTNEPIYPGEEGLVIVAVYDLPYDSDTLSVEMPIPADVASISLLMESQPDVELVSQQLQFIERRELQNSEFVSYGVRDLAAGDVLSFEVTGLDNLTFETAAPSNSSMPAGAVAAPPSIINQDIVRWIVLGLGGAAIVLAALLYPRYRPELAPTVETEPATRRQRLLLLLARLDDAYEAGEIDEAIYRQARAEYKAELMRLMKKETGD